MNDLVRDKFTNHGHIPLHGEIIAGGCVRAAKIATTLLTDWIPFFHLCGFNTINGFELILFGLIFLFNRLTTWYVTQSETKNPVIYL